MSKSACVYALDLACSPKYLEDARQVCQLAAMDRLLYAPTDELAFVFVGTADTENPLTGGRQDRYAHITVCSPLAPPSLEQLRPLQALPQYVAARQKAGSPAGDLLDTLVVCADLLQNKTNSRRQVRRMIYLVTEARHEVQRKEEISMILDSLKEQAISVVVVGVDFTEKSADLGGDWASLPTKAQNERVLHFLCDTVGLASTVVSLEEALEGLTTLRPKKVAQRALSKVPLVIGDIHIAVQFFTKTLTTRLPSLKKVTAEGEEVALQPEYLCVSGEQADHVVRQEDRIRAYHYGRSLIPCTEADLRAMKIEGNRSLEALAFVRREEIPPFILMGGVKAVLPLAGDLVGQRGFSSLTRAMTELDRVLVVRYVATKSSAPVLGVLVPAVGETGDDMLYFAPLPFAEDVRSFRFAEYKEVQCSSKEEALVDSLIDAMTVADDVLVPEDTFNPTYHQFYHTVLHKLMATMSEEKKTASGDEVPPLMPQLASSSAAFSSASNPLAPVLRQAANTLQSVADAFPYEEADPQQEGTKHNYWFRAKANVATTASTPSERAPSTVAAGVKGSGWSEAPTVPAKVVAAGPAAATDRVTTIDPAGTFTAVLASRQKDAVGRGRAMDELSDVILQLLRMSVKDAQYGKCDDGLRALRACCVTENEPTYYNNFLIKLSLLAMDLGHRESYWEPRMRTEAGLRPITQKECANSTLADEAAVATFLSEDREEKQPELSEEEQEDILDLIS